MRKIVLFLAFICLAFFNSNVMAVDVSGKLFDPFPASKRIDLAQGQKAISHTGLKWNQQKISAILNSHQYAPLSKILIQAERRSTHKYHQIRRNFISIPDLPFPIQYSQYHHFETKIWALLKPGIFTFSTNIWHPPNAA